MGSRWPVLILLVALVQGAWAQAAPQPGSAAGPEAEQKFFRNLLHDQKDIYTSPFTIRARDLKWLVPLLGTTTGLIMTDRTISHEFTRGNHADTANKISNYGAATFAGATAGMYVVGRFTRNDHFRESSVLAAEAAASTAGVTEIFKYSFGRLRPGEGDNTGHFFRGSDSFFSAHASLSWSIATVMANEYPGWLSRSLLYGGASAISLARVAAGKHYMSDVFVGSAVGYLIGQHVYKQHHDDNLGGVYVTSWTGEEKPHTKKIVSTYLPIDSWVYPALERLIALGYVRSDFMGQRPWTRIECARMVDEASSVLADSMGGDPQAADLVHDLQAFFAEELRALDGKPEDSVRIDSLYTRFSGISGPTLNDSFHFGQTVVNDYGRPYGQGFSNVTGFATRGESGSFGFYVNGEYQHAPLIPAYSPAVSASLAANDLTPIPAALPSHKNDQFRLLDTYVAVNVLNNQISVGKQSLWWGPGELGPLMFSNNAEPVYMARIDRTTPLKLPSILGLLGPIRYGFMFGKLSGHQFFPQPYINSLKISFHPTENLEIGFSRTAVFAGQGFTPLTTRTFFRSIFSLNESDEPRKDPGDRRSGFDFRYKLPFLRRRVTLYTDSLSDDDPSPLGAPRRAALNPGIYVSKLPFVPRMDFRVEAVNTNPPVGRSTKGEFIYWNLNYMDSHTNKGQILGSFVGREALTIAASTNYWFSPSTVLNLTYRDGKTSKDFIEGGGTIHDAQVEFRQAITKEFWLTCSGGAKLWTYPLLAAGQQRNFIGAIQLEYRPAKRLRW